MDRRAKRPLNRDAASAADDEIYSNHEDDPRPNALYDADGNRKPLSATDPAQADLRREWMDSYVANGGQVESPARNPSPPGAAVSQCPLDAQPGPPPKTADPPAQKANLHVKLEHACDKSPLKDGTVKISGPESKNATTGADGWAKFDGITPGAYTIDGTHPQHEPGNTSASAPAGTTTNVELPLKGKLLIKAVQDAYTVVLDKSGNPTAAFATLEFNITNGPPNHLFDVQLTREGGAPTGGPGLAGSWVEADGRDARMKRKIFSSWSNGQHTLRLDGAGKASLKMPLEWWRDQARQKRADFTDFIYQCRAVAFKDGPTAVCSEAPAIAVKLTNNLVDFKLTDAGFTNGGANKNEKEQFTVKEAGTTDMYTLVQWLSGSNKLTGGPNTDGVGFHYGLRHKFNYPEWAVDSSSTNPRPNFFGGAGGPSISPDQKTATGTDPPGGAISPSDTTDFFSFDFESRVHLNFEVPATVKIKTKTGAAEPYDVLIGVLDDPQPVILDSGTWEARILQVRNADGTVTPSNPDTYP
jgi:hypothetical protein